MKRFFSMFVDLESPAEKVPPESPKPAPAAQPPTVQTPTAGLTSAIPMPVGSSQTEKILKRLEEALAAANLPGFDYLEFRDALVKMAGIPLTEEQRFNAVFSTAQAMGLDKIGLLKSLDHYLSVLAAKHKEFQEYIAQVTEAEVNSKKTLIASLESEIQKDAEKIQELTTAIQARRQQQAEANAAMTQASTEVQGNSMAFEATLSTIVSNLQSDRSKIETYLK